MKATVQTNPLRLIFPKEGFAPMLLFLEWLDTETNLEEEKPYLVSNKIEDAIQELSHDEDNFIVKLDGFENSLRAAAQFINDNILNQNESPFGRNERVFFKKKNLFQ